MANTLTPNKKTDRLINKSRVGSSSISDAGSLGGTSTVSDSRVIRHTKRKTQKSSKDYSIRQKISQNIFNVRHTTNKADNDVRRIRSVSSHIIISPPFFINENKKQYGITKERSRDKNSGKFPITKRKTAAHKTDDSTSRESKKMAVSDLKRSHYFGNRSNSVERPQARFKSLLDFSKKQNIDVMFPHTSCRQEMFSVTSSEKLDFNNTKHRKKHFDYLKEFDLIRYNGMTKDVANLSENERIFSLLPKISPSEPVTLPRKKYSRGVLSVKDSKEVSHETERNDEKDSNDTTMRVEFENADVCRSSEEATASRGDNKCLNDVLFANDKDYVLVVRKPIRIKCIDEASNKIRDIIVYSEEFLNGIVKEKGSWASKREIYESILKESTDYTGKCLRLIIDVEKYSHSLHNNRKSEGDIKPPSTKIPKPTPSRVSKSVIQTKKRTSNIPSCNGNYTTPDIPENPPASEQTQNEKNSQLTKDIPNDSVGIESVVISFTQTDVEDSTRSKSMEILVRENKKFKSRCERKSRTALKRINIESIIASSFSYYFHFYAKLGRSLKSGAAISKTNSTSWLKKCGIVYDSASKSMVEKCFMAVACAKYVLNICDYIKCLNRIARDRRMLLVEILYRMMNVDLHSLKKSGAKQKTDQRKDPVKQVSVPEIKSKLTRKSKKDIKHL